MNIVNISTRIIVHSVKEKLKKNKTLIEATQRACNCAYAPYSNFKVGCAVELNDGTIIEGSNQENAAYPSGLCAERTALFYANAKYPDIPVKTIAITAYHDGDFVKDICSPCGACRQVMAEIEHRFKQDITILMCSKDTVYEVESVKSLLPLAFDKTNLD